MEAASNLMQNSPLSTQPAAAFEDNSTKKTDGTTTTSAASESDFAAFLQKTLQPREAGIVSEEDLFAALMEQRVAKENKEAGDLFKQKRDEMMISLRRPSGFVPMEDMAKMVMKEIVAAGKLTSDVAEKIHAEAFSAAQLDGNLDALYDHLGGPNDSTVATASLADAIKLSEEALGKIEKGEVAITGRSLDTPSNTKGGAGLVSATALGGVMNADGSMPSDYYGSGVIDGAKTGFLWKPFSHGKPTATVLLPGELKGNVDRVEIHKNVPPSAETFVDKFNKYSGEYNNERPIYRFGKAGMDYGENFYVVAFKKDGSFESWKIEDGKKRWD